MSPANLIMSVFFLQGVGLSNFFPRIPDLQAKLGVGPGELSVALLGLPIATVVAVPFAGTLIGRLGPRRIIQVTFVVAGTGLILPGWSWSVPSLFGSLFLIGLAYPLLDIAMNVEADRIERDGGRRIMSTCHGYWSVGSVSGGLIAAGFAAAGVPTQWHLLVVALLMIPAGLWASTALPDVHVAPAETETRRKLFALPSYAILGLCLFLFGTLMVEATARNWSAVFVRDVTGAPAVYGGITFSAFALLAAGGRFAGDRLVDRFGPVPVARICSVVALIGLILVVLAQSPLQVVMGFAAAGFGISIAFPLSVTAAAGRGDLPPAVNVAALQFIGLLAFLIGPPLVGWVSQVAGLRWGVAGVLPMILISVFLAGELRRKAGPKP